MADLRGQQLKDSYQDVVTIGTGNKLENGNGVEFVDLDYKASLSPFIWNNVKRFGAVGDGVANDFQAIQDAVNATPSGGVLFIPEGDYLADVSGDVAGSSVLNINKPMTVWAYGAKIILGDDAGSSMRGVFVRENGVTVFGLDTDGNGQRTTYGGTSEGFDIDQGVDNVKFIDCTAYNWLAEGFDIDGSHDVWLTRCKAIDNRGNGFHFSNNVRPPANIYLEDLYAEGNGMDRYEQWLIDGGTSLSTNGNYYFNAYSVLANNLTSVNGSRPLAIQGGSGPNGEPEDTGLIKIDGFKVVQTEATTDQDFIQSLRGEITVIIDNFDIYVETDLKQRFMELRDTSKRRVFSNGKIKVGTSSLSSERIFQCTTGELIFDNVEIDATQITGEAVYGTGDGKCKINNSEIKADSGLPIRIENDAFAEISGGSKLTGQIRLNGNSTKSLLLGNNLMGTSNNQILTNYELIGNAGIADQSG